MNNDSVSKEEYDKLRSLLDDIIVEVMTIYYKKGFMTDRMDELIGRLYVGEKLYMRIFNIK